MDDQLRDKMLIDVHARMAGTEVNIRDIKEDLRIHIKRSNQNEIRIDYVRKHVFYVQGAIALLGIMATIAAIIRYF